MSINLIGVPLFYGCDIKGVEIGPKILRENGIKEILEKGNVVYDLGDLFIKKCNGEEKYDKNKNVKYLNEIVECNENLAQKVYLSLKNKDFPLIIGGDHSLALGSIAGSSKYYKDDLAIIWIDAHGDFNTGKTSPSGNIHGMPLAASSGIGIDELKNIYFQGAKVNTENIFIICARDLDSGEAELLKEFKVNLYSTSKVKELGINKVILDVFKIIEERNINNIHVSFDIDCMDSQIVPGTGTKVKEGITLEEAIKILQYIFEFNKVRVLDFVEFNPVLDTDNKTLNVCLALFEEINKLISENCYNFND